MGVVKYDKPWIGRLHFKRRIFILTSRLQYSHIQKSKNNLFFGNVHRHRQCAMTILIKQSSPIKPDSVNGINNFYAYLSCHQNTSSFTCYYVLSRTHMYTHETTLPLRCHNVIFLYSSCRRRHTSILLHALVLCETKQWQINGIYEPVLSCSTSRTSYIDCRKITLSPDKHYIMFIAFALLFAAYYFTVGYFGANRKKMATLTR